MSLSPTVVWSAGVTLLLAFGIVLAWLLGWVASISERREREAKGTVIAEYVAPQQLTPAELGYIIDESFGNNELLATIAGLYAKQAVRLRTIPGSDADFIITPSDKDVPVSDSESGVLGYLRGLPDGITWAQLSSASSDIAGAEADFEDDVLESLISKGLLQPGAISGMLFRKRAASVVLATSATLAVSVLLYLWARNTLTASALSGGFASLDKDVSLLIFVPIVIILWVVWFVYANVLVYAYTHLAGMPVSATRQLKDLWPDTAGFRLFLQETEFVRLQSDPQADDPSMAYCLALGLDPGFARSLLKA